MPLLALFAEVGAYVPLLLDFDKIVASELLLELITGGQCQCGGIGATLGTFC